MTGTNISVGTGAGGYDPDIDQLLAGTALFMTPTVTGDTALVDVQTASGDWDALGQPIAVGGRGEATYATTQPSFFSANGTFDAHATVDRLNTPARQFTTTVRLPLGKAILVGGMTLEPTARAEAAAGAAAKADPADKGDARQLYLVLRVSSKEPAAASAPAKGAGR